MWRSRIDNYGRDSSIAMPGSWFGEKFIECFIVLKHKRRRSRCHSKSTGWHETKSFSNMFSHGRKHPLTHVLHVTKMQQHVMARNRWCISNESDDFINWRRGLQETATVCLSNVNKRDCYFTGLCESITTRHFSSLTRAYLSTTDAGKLTLLPSIAIEILCKYSLCKC